MNCSQVSATMMVLDNPGIAVSLLHLLSLKSEQMVVYWGHAGKDLTDSLLVEELFWTKHLPISVV